MPHDHSPPEAINRLDPEVAAAARVLRLEQVETSSMSPWSSVHLALAADGRRVVLKRTGQRSDGLRRWTAGLGQLGVAVLTPMATVELPGDDGPRNWAAYPFVSGRAYDVEEDVAAAGDLLGRMHAAPVDGGVLDDLRQYSWPQTDEGDVTNDLATLGDLFTEHLEGDRASRSLAAVTALGRRWWESSLPRLRHADAAGQLPRTAVSSDYKAANLVIAGQGPVMVDPDNGGVEPRLLDLALATVLMHHESASAPGRLFDRGEWDAFITAYLAQVELTDVERDLWPAALNHQLWEEGTWALEDSDEQAWNDPRQGAFLRDLALATPERFPLPA